MDSGLHYSELEKHRKYAVDDRSLNERKYSIPVIYSHQRAQPMISLKDDLHPYSDPDTP